MKPIDKLSKINDDLKKKSSYISEFRKIKVPQPNKGINTNQVSYCRKRFILALRPDNRRVCLG